MSKEEWVDVRPKDVDEKVPKTFRHKNVRLEKWWEDPWRMGPKLKHFYIICMYHISYRRHNDMKQHPATDFLQRRQIMVKTEVLSTGKRSRRG